MIIHDCDFVGAAEGGPLVLRDADGVHVIAINAGDSSEKRFPRLTAVPYDPKRNFYNFSRRFDLELEQKLVAFVSRFGHLKNPPQAIKARSELIHKVQSNLGRLGYDAGPVDGFLGDKTRDAIKAFQTSLGITPTGRVSEEPLLLLEQGKQQVFAVDLLVAEADAQLLGLLDRLLGFKGQFFRVHASPSLLGSRTSLSLVIPE